MHICKLHLSHTNWSNSMAELTTSKLKIWATVVLISRDEEHFLLETNIRLHSNVFCISESQKLEEA